ASNIVRISLLVIAISIYQSLFLAVVALSIGAFIQAIWYLTIIPRKVRSFRVFDYSIAHEQLMLSFPMLAVSLLGTGVFNIDGIIISNHLGVEEFAIFRAGALEIPFVATIFGTVATVLMPDIARLAAENKGKEIFALNRRASSVTAIVVLPVTLAFVIFGEEFITVYLSEKYIESGLVFSIYTIAVLFRLTLYQSTLLAYKRSKDILLCFLAGFCLSVILNIVLVKSLGVV